MDFEIPIRNLNFHSLHLENTVCLENRVAVLSRGSQARYEQALLAMEAMEWCYYGIFRSNFSWQEQE